LRLLTLYLLVNRRHRRKIVSHRSAPWRIKQAFLGVGTVLAVLVVVLMVFGGAVYTSLTKDLPSLDFLPVWMNPKDGLFLQPTRVYDRTGQHLLFSLENPGIPRRYLFLTPGNSNHFSPYLTEMTVALLDPGFWQSGGASWQNLISSEPVTLAEKLVVDLLLDRETPGLRRSLRMRLLAVQMIRQFGRDQVLEWILNTSYYGHLAYGADSASYLFLNKPASELTLAESALLLAAADAPALNPLDAPAAAIERQKQVLMKLRSSGAISEQEFQQALQTQLPIRLPPPSVPEISKAFDRMVLERLGEYFSQQRLERGGLRIVTTLDADLQEQLVCTVQTQLLRLEKQLTEPRLSADQQCDAALLLPTLPPTTISYPSDLEASAVIQDPQNGQILALLGDTIVTGESAMLSEHQPGSLLTPFVAVAGFGKGFGPASLVWNIPQNLPPELKNQIPLKQEYEGPLRLRNALANDYIAPLTQLLIQLGPENVWKQTESFGLNGLASTPNPSDLLSGGGKITLLQMVQAYATLANQGTIIGAPASTGEGGLQPVIILFVEDLTRRRWLEETQPEKQSVLSVQLAYLVNHILSDDAARRPSLGYPNPLETGIPAGAKIGQLANGLQVWTAGYSSQRVVLVWMGLPEEIDQQNRLDFRPAAGIWHALMQYATRNIAVVEWQTPAGVSSIDVCDPSGLLPTTACPLIVKEIFLSGNEPGAYDTLYQHYQVNRETGRLATIFTPLQLIEERTYLVPPQEAKTWAQKAGLPVPPSSYDTIQAPPPQPGTDMTAPLLFAYISNRVEIRGSAGGELFSSYRLQVGRGLNPKTWQLIGEESPSPVEGGLLGIWDTRAVEDGLYALQLQVLQSDQSIRTAITQVTVDNTPPGIQILSPQAEGNLSMVNDQVNLQVSINDVFGVSKVEWFVDGEKVGDQLQEPFVLSWAGTPGKHSLLVKAYDLAGNSTRTEPITFLIEK
jgi:membrane peptidoglycan carboxypeptidase